MPWEAIEHDDKYYVAKEGSRLLGPLKNRSIALKMAAADEMLDALKHACGLNDLNLSCGRGREQCADCMIDRAIAKAEGRDHG